MLKTLYQEKEYPDPKTLPSEPSWQQPRPQLTLSELIPKQYISTIARIVFLKTTERHDALGNKMVFSGILEDCTFKTPFVSHKITYPLIRNSVYKFNSAYVHEFDDKSLLVIATEHTKIESKNIEDYREFIWAPTTLPTVCDKLNVMAAIHNRKLIAALLRELREKDEIIEKFEERIIGIENQLQEMKRAPQRE